ncbi:MAG: hypothetical protein MRZ42_04705 [Tenericutes bacterium]|nr:hypothetical protein [Mycoplasmatota bacterium]
MAKVKKNKIKKGRVLVVILLIGVILGLFYLKNRKELQVVSVVSEIDSYNYYLESNSTRIYKKYYKELENELKDNKVDEEKYAQLVAELFSIDYYTLNNKVTNKNIGGVQFIHSNLKDKFISDSSNTVYKYIKNNLYKNRHQQLPEVNSVVVKDLKQIKYNKKDYKDDSAYEVTVSIGYVKNYDYPTSLTITLIHENNKLVIVEIK